METENPPSPAPAAPAEPPPRAKAYAHSAAGRLRRMLFTLAGLAVLWVFFAYVIPRMLFEQHQAGIPPGPDSPVSEFPPPPPAPAEAQPQDKIAALEARLAQLEEDRARQPADVTEAVKSLEARLEEQEVQAAALKASIGSGQQAAWKAVALWQAFDGFAAKAQAGAPYADSLDRFSELTTENPTIQGALESLKPYAENGIATREFLSALFADVLPEAFHAADAPGDNASFWARLRYNFSGWITIRKTSDVAGDSSHARLTRAEASLNEGNVADALKEIESLPEELQAPFTAWLDHAKGYIAREEALDAIRQHLAQAARPPAPFQAR